MSWPGRVHHWRQTLCKRERHFGTSFEAEFDIARLRREYTGDLLFEAMHTITADTDIRLASCPKEDCQMPEFRTGEPIETVEPEIEVTATPARPLPVGRNRFQLVVVDDSGNVSAPATVEVIVRDTTNPTAVLDAPREIEFGRSFQLSGRRSSDIPPARIVSYRWTLLT
jgi:hypothetical protein